MYQYYVFAYKRYYPSGGMKDIVLRTNNIERVNLEVKDLIDTADHIKRPSFIHVYDTINDKIIFEWRESDELTEVKSDIEHIERGWFKGEKYL